MTITLWTTTGILFALLAPLVRLMQVLPARIWAAAKMHALGSGPGNSAVASEPAVAGAAAAGRPKHRSPPSGRTARPERRPAGERWGCASA